MPVVACVVAILALFVGLAIAAVILRAACHFAKEDVPDLGKAMGIVFVVMIVQMVIGAGINLVMGVPLIQEPNQPPAEGSVAAGLISFLINTPITMWLYYKMIPTTNFGKAALVWVMQILIVIAIVVLIFILVLGLGMVFQF